MNDTRNTDKVIDTVGEMIRVLMQYKLTAKIVFETQGSYARNIELTREEVYYEDDDTQDKLIILV